MLGQNFLIDQNIADRIVSEASVASGEKVLEIGPGRGILTERLVTKSDLLAVEKDRWLAVVLKQKFANQAEIVEADILKFDIHILHQYNLEFGMEKNLRDYNIVKQILVLCGLL